MKDILNKAAEILVDCRYADDINQDHLAFAHQCGPDGGDIDWEFRPCEPFEDALEGRRQADAIEDWLVIHRDEMWQNEAVRRLHVATEGLYTNHQWRLDRIKWCLEQLAGDGK